MKKTPIYNLDLDVYEETLDNGLKVYICPKKGFTKKIGMFGTIYGSIDNDFIEVNTGKRIKVEDGIAHFLEHKLFEQEGDNALDVFAKMGVSSNAYTSFDHTVYFFETSDKFEESVDKLFNFIATPYFTDENVEKEKGIIAQELKMYDDEPNSVVYYNVLRAMYKDFPLKVDIGGTVESVHKINKEALYSCYNTFYNPKNMFVIIIGDVEPEETLKLIEKSHLNNNTRASAEVIRFIQEEQKEVAQLEIEKKMDVYMPYICIGFKHGKQTGKDNIKNGLIVDLINEACFSTLSDFYEYLYKQGLTNEPVQISYEAGENFAHTVIFAVSKEYKKCEQMLLEYLEELRKKGISEEIFEVVKKKKQGELIFNTEDLMATHRIIVDSIIQNTPVFEETNIINEITKTDVDRFLIKNLTKDNMVISRVIENSKKI